jgi:hypothetical protein
MALGIGVIMLVSALILPVSQTTASDTAYLSWSQDQINSIAKRMRVNGQVGGSFDFRIKSTEKSYNYKLRATWFTPEMIRASARYRQLRERLTDEQTRALVVEAESVGDTVVMVEIDPREGSGVIPSNWLAVLRAKDSEREVKGTVTPVLRQVKALSGTTQRDYAYDLFWVIFPLVDDRGERLFGGATTAELLVEISNKQGKVAWPIPDAIRERFSAPPGR